MMLLVSRAGLMDALAHQLQLFFVVHVDAPDLRRVVVDVPDLLR